MLTVTFEDELEVNATFAALDDRIRRMGDQLATLREQRDSPSNAFAIECTQAAVRHAWRAKLQLLAAVGEPAPVEVVGLPAILSESERRALWGDR